MRRHLAFALRMALGITLLAKAYAVPLSFPPNTGLTRPAFLQWEAWTYLAQVRHWQEQVTALERYPEAERDEFGLYSVTLAQRRNAWVFLAGSSVLGLGLIGSGLRTRRRAG